MKRGTPGPEAKVRVFFYSGYKGGETPHALWVGDREHPIDEVLERKRITDRASGQTFDLFVCRVAGKTVSIKVGESGRCELSPPQVLLFLQGTQ